MIFCLFCDKKISISNPKNVLQPKARRIALHAMQQTRFSEVLNQKASGFNLHDLIFPLRIISDFSSIFLKHFDGD